MVFSSNLFLFVFLPLFLLCYYLTPRRWKSALILFFSYVFYTWWRPDFLVLLVSVTLATYGLALAIDSRQSPRWRKGFLTLGVSLNLAALGYFKYFNFGIQAFNSMLGSFGLHPVFFSHVLLPIGLSFYTFHAISYLVDIYRKEAPPARNVIDFAAFISLFPHLVAGPVLRYHLLAQQFRERVHSLDRFGKGSMLFMAGFCSKVLIADPVAPLADAAFALQHPHFADAWIGAFAYTCQLFFDFSGYSTMAIGLALMIGFVFPQNFDDPYWSASITEFWKRWHMSLSNWLREYLYISMGGNRKGRIRTYVNLLMTMVLGGLWHGSNWTFLAWGAWHGGFLALERYRAEQFGPSQLPRPIRVAGTMLLVVLGWVLFRATTMDDVGTMFGGMSGFNGWGMSSEYASQFTTGGFLMLVLSIGLVYALPTLRRIGESKAGYLLIPLFLWSVATLSAQGFRPFLYFQF
ncbi:MAG: MBOAT family O-acyltransferase [Rhodanobacter sp.]